jgi:hypothetical protein
LTECEGTSQGNNNIVVEKEVYIEKGSYEYTAVLKEEHDLICATVNVTKTSIGISNRTSGSKYLTLYNSTLEAASEHQEERSDTR